MTYGEKKAMVTIGHISVGSAFVVDAAIFALLFALIGFFVILLPGLAGLSIIGALAKAQESNSYTIGAVGSILVYLFGIFANAVFGGIVTALEAWLYNMAAGLTGGLRIRLL